SGVPPDSAHAGPAAEPACVTGEWLRGRDHTWWEREGAVPAPAVPANRAEGSPIQSQRHPRPQGAEPCRGSEVSLVAGRALSGTCGVVRGGAAARGPVGAAMAAAAVVAATVPAPTKGADGASSVHWFRKGLRLHDNPALLAAVRGARCVRCVYILDPWFAASSSVGINRWRFLLQSLEDLDTSLRKLNSRLFVVRERDAAIMKMAKEAGVEVVTETSHTLYDLDRIIELNGQKPPLTYKRFQAIISRMELPKKMENCRAEIRENHDDTYGVPSLEELGFPTEGLGPAVWQGGETEALARLDKHLERKAWVANYERPRMNANSLLASPTGLSPYLRFGCLSCRLFYYRLWDLYKKLLWREFFYTAATNNPRFDRMEGNPICIQIPWDRNPEALAKWEGWIHHLARHAVACFLTRGDLWVSWESGVRVFDELLLDADFSVNAGSWMWLSCSAFFQQFFHCYCPVGFGRRTDPSGDYIRRYLPKLKGFPSRYIYEPWNAPESVQKAAKCIIGVDYPRPIVNHAETSRGLLASVPSCVEDLSHPVADPSSNQAGSISNTGPRPISSGPTSPKRKLEAAEEPSGEELSKRARVTEMPAQEPPSKDA
ncbi:Cry2, partial [Lemmus lemmus]